MTKNYVQEWQFHMEKMQFGHRDENGTYSNIPGFTYQPSAGLNIGNDITIDKQKTSFFDVVQKNLKELGISEDYSDGLLRGIWDEPFKKFRRSLD